MTEAVYFQVEPTHITYVTRILEGYEYLGVITTIDGKKGIAKVRSTEGTRSLVCQILQSIPIEVKIFEDIPLSMLDR